MGQICLSEWDSIVHMAGLPLEFKEGSLHCLMEHCRCHAKSKRIAWDSYRLSSRMKTIWFQITFVNFDMPTDALQVYQQEIVCVRALPSLSSMYWSGYRSFFFFAILFTLQKSTQGCNLPSFYCTRTTGVAQGLFND